MFLLEKISINALIAGFLAVFSLSTAHQFWVTYKMSHLEEVVSEQLDGKLSETARVIASVNDRLKTAESRMVSPEDLEKVSREMLQSLDRETLTEINRLRSETGAQITSISQRFSRLQTEMKKGFASIGEEPTTPPPPAWNGISSQEVGWCVTSPASCAVTPFTWLTPYKVDGFPVAQFKSDNLWERNFTLTLNLAFKIITIGWSEKEDEGAVQNQGIHIQAGYFSEDGQFKVLAEDKLMKGDPNIDPKLFYVPKVSPSSLSNNKLSLFTPTFLAGVGYSVAQDQMGVVIGGSFLNLGGGKIRIGADVLFNTSYLAGGVMASYHYMLGGKYLNIAPMMGALLGTDNQLTLQVGLLFQVW